MNALTDVDWSRDRVIGSLRAAGWTVRGLAGHHDVSPSALFAVFDRTYPRAQQIIADAIGVHPRLIWPSRYDAAGKCLARRPGRPRLQKAA